MSACLCLPSRIFKMQTYIGLSIALVLSRGIQAYNDV